MKSSIARITTVVNAHDKNATLANSKVGSRTIRLVEYLKLTSFAVTNAINRAEDEARAALRAAGRNIRNAKNVVVIDSFPELPFRGTHVQMNHAHFM